MSQERTVAAVVGMFDGVHRGHQALLGQLNSVAHSDGGESVAITFANHPLSLVAPDREPRRLTTAEERDGLLNALVDRVVVLDFDDRLRSLTSAEFIAMLRDTYDVNELLVGFNNRFGSDRHREFDDYRADGERLGVRVVRAAEYRHGDLGAPSSSAIRSLMADGDFDGAVDALGHAYPLSGIVGHGKEIGRTIGFPTANVIDIDPRKIVPNAGVYAGLARLSDGKMFPAMVNIGHRPTVDSCDAPLSVEAHLIGVDADLYGSPLKLELAKRLRSERRFDSLAQLREQLGIDRAATLAFYQ